MKAEGSFCKDGKQEVLEWTVGLLKAEQLATKFYTSRPTWFPFLSQDKRKCLKEKESTI